MSTHRVLTINGHLKYTTKSTFNISLNISESVNVDLIFDVDPLTISCGTVVSQGYMYCLCKQVEISMDSIVFQCDASKHSVNVVIFKFVLDKTINICGITFKNN